MTDIPVSKSIVPRPVWERHLARSHPSFKRRPWPPTEEEKRDAIRVLEDSSNAEYAPELYAEAERILEEAGRDEPDPTPEAA